MSVSRTVSEIFSVKEWRDLDTGVGVVQGHWKWRRSIDHIRLFIGPPLYIYIYIYLCGTVFELLDVGNIVTLKSGLEVTEGHSNWYHSKARVRFPARLP